MGVSARISIRWILSPVCESSSIRNPYGSVSLKAVMAPSRLRTCCLAHSIFARTPASLSDDDVDILFPLFVLEERDGAGCYFQLAYGVLLEPFTYPGGKHDAGQVRGFRERFLF